MDSPRNNLFRRALSVLLVAPVGLVLGAVVFGAATIFVYMIGAWIGAPIGVVCGGFLGYRMPLRDSVLLFVCCFSGMAAGKQMAGTVGKATARGDLLYGLHDILTPAIGALVGVFVLYLILIALVPFAKRRGLAWVLGIGWLAWLGSRVYIALWVPRH